MCPYGFKCRLLDSHTITTTNVHEGFQGSGLDLKIDWHKLQEAAPEQCESSEARLEWAYRTRGELNNVQPERLLQIRRTATADLPISKGYLSSIGEPLDSRVVSSKGRIGRHPKSQVKSPTTVDPSNPVHHSNASDRSNDFSAELLLRPAEKKKLNFEGKLYLAPLTTTGNLPFRRLCVGYGADITCGEMGLAQEFLGGNKGEWSLVRRHPSEKCFGVQICGNRPQTLVAATEHLKREAPELDFIDLNTGCPIDLVVKKGAGSALLDQGGKLGKILRGMSLAAGPTPITIKMRTGIKTGVNTTHKLMSRAVKEWGVGAVTVCTIFSFRACLQSS